MPYDFRNYGNAVSYNNEIHILGSYVRPYNQHFKWNGSEWVEVSTTPIGQFSNAIVYNNEIHIFGGYGNETAHYKWDGSVWTSVSTLPDDLVDHGVIIYNNKIYMSTNDNLYIYIIIQYGIKSQNYHMLIIQQQIILI